jgi:hypothetical protein
MGGRHGTSRDREVAVDGDPVPLIRARSLDAVSQLRPKVRDGFHRHKPRYHNHGYGQQGIVPQLRRVGDTG